MSKPNKTDPADALGALVYAVLARHGLDEATELIAIARVELGVRARGLFLSATPAGHCMAAAEQLAATITMPA